MTATTTTAAAAACNNSSSSRGKTKYRYSIRVVALLLLALAFLVMTKSNNQKLHLQLEETKKNPAVDSSSSSSVVVVIPKQQQEQPDDENVDAHTRTVSVSVSLQASLTEAAATTTTATTSVAPPTVSNTGPMTTTVTEEDKKKKKTKNTRKDPPAAAVQQQENGKDKHHDNDETDHDDEKDPVDRAVRTWREKFPACAALVPLDNNNNNNNNNNENNNNRRIMWKRAWNPKYVPANTITTTTTTSPTTNPRYDHLSCFVMKTRYNCASTKRQKARAFDYKLILQRPTTAPNNNSNNNKSPNSTEACDLRALVDYIHGPVGVARAMRHRETTRRNNNAGKTNNNNNNNTQQEQPEMYNIIFLGNSFLRQMWEAVTCGWRHAITNLTLSTAGPAISLEALRQRQGRKVPVSELGRRVPFSNLILVLPSLSNSSSNGNNSTVLFKGCHASAVHEDPHQFYEQGVESPIPTSIPNCHDNIAMVEFNHTIRFYYIFRPYIYENLLDLYRWIGLSDVTDITAMLFNSGELENYESSGYAQQLLQPHVWKYQTMSWADGLKGSFERWQRRDLNGTWFGADNPGMFHPPDSHPCMPGVPDDEINLYLFALLANVQLVF